MQQLKIDDRVIIIDDDIIRKIDANRYCTNHPSLSWPGGTLIASVVFTEYKSDDCQKHD